jgi:Ca2+-binding RTX toxin-like protein
VRLLATAVLWALVASAPAAAAGSSARLTFTSGTTLELHGASRGGQISVEAHQAGVSLVTTFSDDAAPIVVAIHGSGVACRGSGSKHVTCASQVVTRLRVFGGRGDDAISMATAQGARLRSVTAHGGGGDDTIDLSGVSVPTYITGGAGNDKLTGGSGDDVLSGGSGADVLRGGPGYDVADYSRRTAPISVSLDGAADDGTIRPAEGDDVGADIEEVRGGAGADKLSAGPNGTTLVGNGGDDVLIGGPGDDTLVGGLGADTMSGGAGTDTVDYSARTMDVAVTLDGAANDGAVGEGDNVAADVENVIGGLGSDLLVGGPGPNDLDGGPGDDVIDGDGGRDVLHGGDGDDTIRARDGQRDDVSCGPGQDAALVDQLDSVDADCETADTTGDTVVDSRFEGVGLPAGRLAYDRRGIVRVPVTCPPVETSCTGNLMLRIGPRLISTRLYAPGDQLVEIAVHLPPALRHPALVQLSVRAADAAGNQRSTHRRARLVKGRGAP